MASQGAFTEIASLAGDPARAGMLHALMDGRALTAGELAQVAHVTPQTASGHLTKLAAGGLIAVEKQGRHRYHRLASPAVARMLESIMQVAAGAARRKPVVTGPRDQALRAARTCYDHLAGHLGVALADSMIANRQIELTADAGIVTADGATLFERLGITLETRSPSSSKPLKSSRILCRPCLDWSERRPHIGGALGAALCAHCLTSGWIRRVDGSRAVSVTTKGRQAFRKHFDVEV
ncbi:ArsR/SmtB family transcription factor [Undibacter mobilis]|uniref:Transcriptional regulator n=1 Tax=Undibacter mobilis TaxID=2292256 RepID=A0A371B9B1_9BRAD|nr:helix-turn-helix transcriptional regulator [Undibacter mobilis]RDV04168.1 transcriptional regulator [Undibacter mobilis]